MAPEVSTPGNPMAPGHRADVREPGRWSTVVAISALIALGLTSALAAVLWFQYGTAIFFQMLAAGIAACF